MKTIAVLLATLALAGCALVPTVPPSSPDYPVIAPDRKSSIEDLAWRLDGQAKKDEFSPPWKVAVENAENQKILSEVQADQVRRLISADAQNAQAEKKREAEQREAEEKNKAEYTAKLERDRAAAAARNAENDRYAFEQSFEAIADPTDAKNFQYAYSNHPDPGGLLRKAEQRGYQQGVKTAAKCIDRANAIITQQKQIAAEVGYIDKNVMYQAGAALVRCKKNLADWSKLVKK